MALSDVCSDNLHNLAEDLVHYTYWGYGASTTSQVIDSIYCLAALMNELDSPIVSPQSNADFNIHRTTIGAILDTDDSADKKRAIRKLKMLAEISEVNPRLAQGLEALHHEVTANPNGFTATYNPHYIKQLNKIKKYKN
ncbi:hypothetical protein E6Q11_06645 [Candidatus Dojkabacteria bacterium]|uniref:Uncharacterized protein n=1 Tax=Candidatus Dojkabacteria bacterium TaxID=2099670 RepID=A0A5C7J341_9BACT|nr:MAG: hypothetical protein E6Q11_06645 [Candidatus Dojkabacteria bacterium]